MPHLISEANGVAAINDHHGKQSRNPFRVENHYCTYTQGSSEAFATLGYCHYPFGVKSLGDGY
jgi:hypothetical protein